MAQSAQQKEELERLLQETKARAMEPAYCTVSRGGGGGFQGGEGEECKNGESRELMQYVIWREIFLEDSCGLVTVSINVII
jgi:hypothetical protein